MIKKDNHGNEYEEGSVIYDGEKWHIQPPITIQRIGACFNVIVGEKESEQITYDEMLGLITQLTMPGHKHCLSWLKTPAEHQEWRNSLKERNNK